MKETSTTQSITYSFRDSFARLRKSSFVGNVLVVMSGTAAAQAIGFALTPVISRLFSPADFGIFGAFSAISGVISAGVTLEYTQAIMLPKEKDDALHLFYISCLCTIAISMLCLAFCLLFHETLHEMMKTEGAWVTAMLVLATLANGLNSSCQAWCVRVKAFKETSASQVVRSLSSNSMQVGFGIIKLGAPGLIISSILADFLATINLARVILLERATLPRMTWDRIVRTAKDYRDFPLYSASQNVINALSSGLPVLLLTHYYGIVVAGVYAFGMRILLLPMGLVLRALRQVLFQKAGETLHRGEALMPLYVKITAGLFAMILLPSVLLIIWSPEIFAWVFGSQWLLAGEYARCLVLWLMFYFCNAPAVLFAQLIRIQRTFFIYDLFLLAARTLVLVIGGTYLSAWNTVLLFSIVGALMNLFLILLVGYAVMKKEGHVKWEQIRNSF
jgi:O-antigen/teichoic acid export membrane protein